MAGIQWYRDPERVLADLVKRAARGEIADRTRFMRRATVLAVDLEGGKLQNPTGSGTVTSVTPTGTRTLKATVGPENPRGSVKARVLTDGYDRMLDDDSLRVFWPMLPFDQLGLPVVPGEHVYVLFEGEGTDQGVWLSRVSGHESAGAFVGTESYTAVPGRSAADVYDPLPVDYETTDDAAALAPSRSAASAFGED